MLKFTDARLATLFKSISRSSSKSHPTKGVHFMCYVKENMDDRRRHTPHSGHNNKRGRADFECDLSDTSRPKHRRRTESDSMGQEVLSSRSGEEVLLGSRSGQEVLLSPRSRQEVLSSRSGQEVLQRSRSGQEVLSARREAYDRDFPVYKMPVEVGSFSLDPERRFFNDRRAEKYYVEPDRTPRFDLRDGYRDRFVKRDDGVKEKLDHLLRWILTNKSKLTKTCRLDHDFVTWRGHLTKVLTTPYSNMEGWLLAVTRFRGTLYISEVETEASRQMEEKENERQKEMKYWGYKFEQYMCSDDVHGSPDPNGVVNTNTAFCTVVQTRLEDHRLLFSGEVDCRDKDPNAPAPPACYVELKTTREILEPRHLSTFYRFRLMKWWAQSFLPGVPRVVAGFRNDDGVVVSTETFQTSKMSQLAKNEINPWKPTICMNFCCDFLSFVKSVATDDDPDLVYLFSWEPHMDVGYSIHRNSSYSFLPRWFVEGMTGGSDSQQV